MIIILILLVACVVAFLVIKTTTTTTLAETTITTTLAETTITTTLAETTITTTTDNIVDKYNINVYVSIETGVSEYLNVYYTFGDVWQLLSSNLYTDVCSNTIYAGTISGIAHNTTIGLALQNAIGTNVQFMASVSPCGTSGYYCGESSSYMFQVIHDENRYLTAHYSNEQLVTC